MEYVVIILGLVLVFAFWGTLRTINRRGQEAIELSSEMALRGLKNSNREQKYNSAKQWSNKAIEADTISKATANVVAIDALDI